MKDEIKFNVGLFNIPVICYKKESGYDVYINGGCVKISATINYINKLREALA